MAGADGSGGWNLRIAKKIDPQILLFLTTGTPNFGDAPPCRFLALDPKLQAGGLRAHAWVFVRTLSVGAVAKSA